MGKNAIALLTIALLMFLVAVPILGGVYRIPVFFEITAAALWTGMWITKLSIVLIAVFAIVSVGGTIISSLRKQK